MRDVVREEVAETGAVVAVGVFFLRLEKRAMNLGRGKEGEPIV